MLNNVEDFRVDFLETGVEHFGPLRSSKQQRD